MNSETKNLSSITARHESRSVAVVNDERDRSNSQAADGLQPEHFRMGSEFERPKTDQSGKPTHAKADEFNQTAGEEHILLTPILESITEADIHQLLYIEQVKIPHCIGITDDDRAKLKRAVQARYIELNTLRKDSSHNKFSAGRWTGSLHTSGETTGTKNDGTKR